MEDSLLLQKTYVYGFKANSHLSIGKITILRCGTEKLDEIIFQTILEIIVLQTMESTHVLSGYLANDLILQAQKERRGTRLATAHKSRQMGKDKWFSFIFRNVVSCKVGSLDDLGTMLRKPIHSCLGVCRWQHGNDAGITHAQVRNAVDKQF